MDKVERGDTLKGESLRRKPSSLCLVSNLCTPPSLPRPPGNTSVGSFLRAVRSSRRWLEPASNLPPNLVEPWLRRVTPPPAPQSETEAQRRRSVMLSLTNSLGKYHRYSLPFRIPSFLFTVNEKGPQKFQWRRWKSLWKPTPSLSVVRYPTTPSAKPSRR